MIRDSYRANPTLTAARRLLSAFLAVALLATPVSALTVARKKQIARTQFEDAMRMREALNGRPAKDRKLKDYQRVIDAYRRVYYVAPTSSKADESIVAVAELLAEEGRAFHNDETLKKAIAQYEFLRKEYPGSKHRVEALYTIAQIYKDDLSDNDKAKETLQEYLKHYPKSQLADDARAALKELDQPLVPAKIAAKSKDKQPQKLSEKLPEPKPVAETKPDTSDDDSPADSEEHKSSKVIVTGVRHWSTPDYTRIAIDLEQEIKYDSGRIPHPDRIYFDLKDTRLSSILKGKTFDVDDGFLKKIRVAQFAPGLTRVVLEVGDDVGEYSAFLLPNPYRLIVDIHGKKTTKLMARTQQPRDESDIAKPVEAEKPKPPKPEIASARTEPAPKTVEKAAEKKPEMVAKASEPKPIEIKPVEPKIVEQKIAEQKEPVKSKPVEVAANSKKEVPTKIVEPEPAPAKPELTKEAPAVVAKNTAPATSSSEEPPIRARGKKRQAPERLSTRTAQPTTDGERSLIRALGLKIGRIVVDAGHGGHDTGTIGPNGLQEKDLVLDVALKLGKLLSERLGAEVVYTRDDDTFIPLETRTAIANQQQADLFISVHANSSSDQTARGVETYYLNFTSSRDALEVAARENSVSEKSIHELQDLVKKIALKEKIEESREFALDVQQSLHTGLATKAPAIRDRGVKKAPFIVLIGANMPSILAEISFISNPTDEKRLQTGDYREKIAESLYRGVAKYVSGLSGVKVAAKLPEKEGE
jgi:N-acetylmuramoyl-L-alanine amidase